MNARVRWQLQEAKQRFSEVIRAAEAGETQIVTRHGHDVAVVIDIAEYRRLRQDEQSTFHEYLRAEPALDDNVELTVPRGNDTFREVDLLED